MTKDILKGEGAVKYCQICGGEKVEIHHIIFRSEASYLANLPINFKYLCFKCHRGKKGPHFSKEVDFKFKRELQDKLYNIFKGKKYYGEEDIKNLLNISISEVLRVVNPLKIYKEGYYIEDIILRLLGGRLYLEPYEVEIKNLMEKFM